MKEVELKKECGNVIAVYEQQRHDRRMEELRITMFWTIILIMVISGLFIVGMEIARIFQVFPVEIAKTCLVQYAA